MLAAHVGEKMINHPVLEALLTSDQTVDAAGEIKEIFSTSISRDMGEAIASLIQHGQCLHTLEIGCAYGISALFICQALAERRTAGAHHVIIDPFQSGQFNKAGTLNFKWPAMVALAGRDISRHDRWLQEQGRPWHHDHCGTTKPCPMAVIVVANTCTDDTGDTVRRPGLAPWRPGLLGWPLLRMRSMEDTGARDRFAPGPPGHWSADRVTP